MILEGVAPPSVHPHHADRLVAGVVHDALSSGTLLRGRGDESSPQPNLVSVIGLGEPCVGLSLTCPSTFPLFLLDLGYGYV